MQTSTSREPPGLELEHKRSVASYMHIIMPLIIFDISIDWNMCIVQQNIVLDFQHISIFRGSPIKYIIFRFFSLKTIKIKLTAKVISLKEKKMFSNTLTFFSIFMLKTILSIFCKKKIATKAAEWYPTFWIPGTSQSSDSSVSPFGSENGENLIPSYSSNTQL